MLFGFVKPLPHICRKKNEDMLYVCVYIAPSAFPKYLQTCRKKDCSMHMYVCTELPQGPRKPLYGGTFESPSIEMALEIPYTEEPLLSPYT